MEFKKIDFFEDEYFKPTENMTWLKEHCLELTMEEDKECEGLYTLKGSFGGNEGTDNTSTNNFGITRNDIIAFLNAYLPTQFPVYANFNIDALDFSSDGDVDECYYTICADVFFSEEW